MPEDTGSEIAAIHEGMRTDFHEYQSNPEKQSRYLALLDAEGRGGDIPASPGRVEAELAEIQQTMKTDFQAYRSSPEMQSRYLALLQEKEGGADGRDMTPAAGEIESATKSLGDVIKDLQSDGAELSIEALDGPGRDIAETVPALQKTAQAMFLEIGTEEGARQFSEAFDNLPDRVQANAFQCLLSDSNGERTRPPADDAIRRPTSQKVLAEWGRDAAFRSRVVGARMEKIYDGVTPAEKAELDHFFTSAPEAEWEAILRQLGNPNAVHKRP